MSPKQRLAFFPILASLLLCSASQMIPKGQNSPTVIHRFPVGAWCENLAPTPDGKILVTRLDVPELYLIDPSLPSSSNARLLATIPDVTGLTGITPVSPNVYAFAAGNASITTATAPPDSFSIWRANLTASTPSISKIADVPQAIFPNGLTLLSATAATILLADANAGVIWRFDTLTGALNLAINNTAVAPPAGGFPIGVNGIRVCHGHLYYTNSGLKTFGRVPIDLNTGAATDPFSVLASNFTNDDFTLGRGVAYIASGMTEEITKVNLAKGNAVSVFAGNPNSTEVAGATSVRFGVSPKTRDTLFVSSNGGLVAPVNGSVTVGGAVLAFKL